jgi:hypothetical protein
MITATRFFVGVMACALLASNSTASTLTKNGTFDSDVSQWDISGTCTTLGWESFSGHTGGALSINCFSASSVGSVKQCVAVSTAETAMNFSTEVTNNGAAGPVAFGLSAYAAADCSGTPTVFLDPAETAIVAPDVCCGTVWTRFARENLALPPSTESVLVDIVVASPADISIDNIRLNPGIFQNDFELGD